MLPFHDNVRAFLEFHRIPNQRLARSLRMSTRNVRRILNGHTALSAWEGQRIADALGLPAAELVYLDHSDFLSRHVPLYRRVA
jgi:plasmid maintenance system antidote protein VapI